MDEQKPNVAQLRKTQAPAALLSLEAAVTEHIADLNLRMQAGLAVRRTPMAFEVHALEKNEALLSVRLTGENNLYYTHLIKRSNEMQSGVIYVRASQDGSPAAILFSDFPRSNVQVTYKEASNRLLNSSF